ncbi:hypothetical protein Lal_00039713 [Lupinus albus]|nr:hypothetical protein Lal_00039713 [Lupinus albus]
MVPFNYVKYHIVIKKNSLGPLGIIVQVANLYSFYCLITHNQILITPNFQIDKFKETFKVMKYYVMDGNHRIYKPDLYRNIVLNASHLNWHFPIIIIVEKSQIKNGPHLKSDRVTIICRLREQHGDITQGLPIVEQVVEVCSIDSISMNLENKLTRVQSSISLVNKIQKVYRSQGVHIHNRYIEIIVCQIASKVLVSEDGMSNVFIAVNLLACCKLNERGMPWKKRFSFSKSRSLGSYRLVERLERKHCFKGKDTYWYQIQKSKVPFKAT